MADDKEISKKHRRTVLDAVLLDGKGFHGAMDGMAFLERLWDLTAMPSTDRRYSNAWGDVHTHWVSFGDWDDDYLLITRLSLLDTSVDEFKEFVDLCVHPRVVPDDEARATRIAAINTALDGTGWQLKETGRLGHHAMLSLVHALDEGSTPASTSLPIPKLKRPLNVLISSPGDLRPERLALASACKEIATKHGIPIRPILWEGGNPDHPDIPPLAPYQDEGNVQDIINGQLDELGGIDVYLGMVWVRMGMKTGPFRSGTEAELRVAQERRKKNGRPATILFYHKTEAIPYRADRSQLDTVLAFVEELKASNLLTEFQSLRQLIAMVTPHLEQAIRKAAKAEGALVACPECHSLSLLFGTVEEVDYDEDGPSGVFSLPTIECSDCEWRMVGQP